MVSGLQLGHRWWCRIGDCAAARTWLSMIECCLSGIFTFVHFRRGGPHPPSLQKCTKVPEKGSPLIGLSYTMVGCGGGAGLCCYYWEITFFSSLSGRSQLKASKKGDFQKHKTLQDRLMPPMK